MRGSIIKRGRTWSYVVDIGRDPLTGKRRQRWKGGFATRQAAEQALATALAGRANGIVEPSRLTLDAYVAQWLSGHTLTLKPTTAKSYRELLTWYVLPTLGAAKSRVVV